MFSKPGDDVTDRMEQDETERRIADVRARLVHLTPNLQYPDGVRCRYTVITGDSGPISASGYRRTSLLFMFPPICVTIFHEVFTDIGHPVVFQFPSAEHFPAFGRGLAVIPDTDPDSASLSILRPFPSVYGQNIKSVWIIRHFLIFYQKVFCFLDTFRFWCYIIRKTD